MVDSIPPKPKTGRGAVSIPAGRFEKYTDEAIDDGWRHAASDDNEPSKISTNLHIDTSRSVITEINSPDLPFMRSINPYRGCEHGCIYCYARPTHSYLGYSPGLDFETGIFYKPMAADILRHELAAKKYVVKIITLGSNTDCYQPVERELGLTRQILEVLSTHNHPVTIITKSALVLRDLDILAPMATQNLVRVFVSLTTLDKDLARVLEPRAASPLKRVATMKTLSDHGIPVGVMTAPLIPALNDMEIEKLLEAAYGAGARSAGYTLIRLPYELKELFSEWLKTHRPERAEHVLSLIRQTRGGKLYDADFSQRRTGKGEYAELIAQRVTLAKRRLGFPEIVPSLCTDFFQVPDNSPQFAFNFV